ncbi:MAG: phosphoribosylformylglycinamidine synthase subunit PurQ [Bdellovibrionales bacterium]|nr:phosphoribosylformylglycinamidine synthase subunit PurQ [Bdellovibrionales bacterium]
MKPVAVVRFPGTQCDQDVVKAIKLLHYPVKTIGHADRFSPKDYSAFILPGGFSYGDYLRAGALAVHSQAMQDIYKAAEAGRPILGICNGFQILCEAGLLEGTLQVNQTLRFIDKWVELELIHSCSVWGGDQIKKTVCIPIAHKEGRFYASEEKMKMLQDQSLIWWKYKKNPNGSLESIAGIMNKQKNVAGLMPHPERAMAEWMGGTAGISFFKTFF